LPEEVSAQATKVSGVEPAQLEQVERWAGDRLVPVGDDPAVALAPGTAFRTAYDEALIEIEAGLASPSPEWRRRFALVLGLQRILSEEKPHLSDGLELRAHQIDALAGMLAALLGDAQRNWDDESGAAAAENGNGNGEEDDAPPPLADDSGEADSAGAPLTLTLDFELEDDDDDDDDTDDTEGGDSELDSGDEADENGDGAELTEPIHDPGAVRRYRFKHPTASGKTVAAAGFVDAATITGVLILTHRRLLVEQFKRDLTQHGYGGRIREAVLEGKRGPTTPPVTIETYAWFIRNAELLNRDVYGVVLCDEAHTALGEKTAAAIRALDTPTYIGMTATDQLLQKHVGDVFPAEVADFPLADAVKSGVVAPLRAVRVRPGASLRRVRIVGGDFDQQELAQALDHDALNMAAAMYYQHMFGNKPGIVYSAGVDHAERVAAAMRVVGLKAAAVSGRTPPRELAFTLAAYERGEINVLVNAQLLAEGWNAPRATVCMHLAPTASKRVYQQRIGRIMRLHRRKEAGVVVDFSEATAPHTDRTVTVHSLLGVDVYHPGALVTPRSPRRRQRWRRLAKPLVREAGWLVPVTADPLKRREIILRDWKQIAIDRLPVDEQGMWAENAGRRVGQKDLQKLAKVLTSVSEETRMLFFATCAAENKHRQLRLIALGDLAQNRPTANVFERATRLVEAAPTWRLDRAQGARTLLLALGDRRVEASDHQMVAWAWRLARASRDAQFRHLTSAHESGRDVARALAGKSGDEVVRAAKGIAAMALASPLDLGAALLAVVQTTDLGASRILDDARDRLSGDAAGLAAALGANIPLPRAPRRPQPAKRPAQRPAREAAVVEVEPTEAADVGAAPEQGAAEGEPKKRKRRRRRRRGGGQGANAVAAETGAEAVVETPPAPEQAPAAVGPKRPRRPKAPLAAMDGTAVETPAAVPAAEVVPDRPKRTRRPAAKTLEASTETEVAPPPAAAAEPAAARPRRPRRPKAEPAE
jgi:superfamily II DNA/RNA helicase